MSARRLRVLDAGGSPADIGRAHGKAYPDLIRRYLADRLDLSGDPAWAGRSVGRATVLRLAEKILDHHRSYSPELFTEMEAMAEAAGITPAESVALGGFTDLVDFVRSEENAAPSEDDCTAVIDPLGGVLAQTWDMHASAVDYVLMLRLAPDTGPSAVVQTTVGCLGQIGINEAGIAVGINNLASWGRPGVTWPFVVRKALGQSKFAAAVESVMEAELAGGHNFLLMGPDGDAVNIEAMPDSKTVTPVMDVPFVHTNHCLDAMTAEEEADQSIEHVESSRARLEKAAATASDLTAFFSDPVISRRPGAPHETATCGAVIMRPSRLVMEAVWGVPGDRPWETFEL